MLSIDLRVSCQRFLIKLTKKRRQKRRTSLNTHNRQAGRELERGKKGKEEEQGKRQRELGQT